MKRYSTLLVVFIALPLLFISTWHGVMLLPIAGATHGPMAPSDCLSACGSQQQPSMPVINLREEEKQKEPQFKPAEPYYVQFMQATFAVVLISAAFLLRHLHWQPPDLIKLTTAYRI